ncbi:MAG: alpha/beta hydrolase [Brevundimonas sp.]|uniref:alpha/beta hydrolase n=1 Tax=Brevundimonas sp. TaxID=1871086 RepID=UPI0012049ED1|nr:alpha/beta hydrolase [Brevundimonas sp.]RZJ16441.1 MAG: alpha/beta hydrolase [Brevundimonas sp.]
MTLRLHTVEFAPAQLAALRRVNAILARAPRLRTDPWRVEAGQRLSTWLDAASGRLTPLSFKRRGVTVEIVDTGGDQPVPLRILRPDGRPRAVVLDIHGGGWVLGSAGLNDRLNAHLVHHGFCVVSIDYRLLSERRGVYIDAAIADCVRAARWTLEHLDDLGAHDLFMAGESAGGHLAALTVIALRDQGLADRVRGCVFAYGVFDLSGTDSVRAAGPQTLLFNGPTMQADLARLAPDRDEAALRHADVSPLYADLTDVPPALFLAGGRDPLFEDSALMAARWGEASDADLIRVPQAPHGFLHFGGPAARGARQAIRHWMGARLAD